MLNISLIEKLKDLIKKGQSHLISKTDLGNRTLYLYQLPTGEMKEVFHKKPIKQSKPKAKKEEKAKVPNFHSKDEDAPKAKRQKKVEAEKATKYAKYEEPTAGRRHSNYLPPSQTEYEFIRSEDCRSTLPMKWKILKKRSNGIEMHLLEGNKFHISLYDFKSTPDKDRVSFAVAVQNVQKDVPVYRKRLELPVREFIRDPMKYLVSVSFIRDQDKMEDVAHWVTVDNVSDFKSVVHGIEYGLEITYFEAK